MSETHTAAFDAVAESYDASFSVTELGQLLRARTRTRLAQFRPGTHVLELGCGTGEDAVWLAQRGVTVLATDASPAMLEQTLGKARQAGVGDRVETRWFDLSSPVHDWGECFDGAFSNFGALSCVRDLAPLARWLAAHIQPGGVAVLVVMGSVCLWEIAAYASRWDWQGATRRWQRAGALAHVGGNVVRVYYPSARAVTRGFAPQFRCTHLEAIGVLLPPPYLSGFAARHPRWIRLLAHWEARLAATFPFNALGDHYLLELSRE